MEHALPELSVNSKLKVISAETAGTPLKAVVDASDRHYWVAYVQPRGAPPLEAGQWLNVVTPAQIVMAVRLNAQYEPEGEPYRLYNWELL